TCQLGHGNASGIINVAPANSDNIDVLGRLDGISGLINAQQISYGDIGEGHAITGSGDFAQAGIYATTQVRYVTNINGNGDIRGTIASSGRIGQIVLNTGSIVNAGIHVIEDFEDTLEFGGEFVNPNFGVGESSAFPV